MPNKKGSRVAASRERARANAKKKAHSTGPAIPAAARDTPPSTPEEPETTADQPDSTLSADVRSGPARDEVQGQSPSTAVAAHAPPRAQRGPARRERQALAAVQAGNLRREVTLIGIVTALSGVAIAVLKVVTDIGR